MTRAIRLLKGCRRNGTRPGKYGQGYPTNIESKLPLSWSGLSRPSSHRHALVVRWILGTSPRMTAIACELRIRLTDPKPALPVPVLDRLLGIEIEGEVILADRRLHPARLVAQHQMRAGRRDGQRRIDDRREGMHQVRPGWIEQPQSAAAFGAEVALSRTDLAIAAIVFANLRAVDTDGFSPSPRGSRHRPSG